MGGLLWKVDLVDGTTVWMPRDSARSLEELAALPPLEKRRAIVRHAERFIETPYFWGGRSPASDRATPASHPAISPVRGVDCSGLVNLAYRAVGLEIPRDAHEQFLRAHRINAPRPADLIFLSERSNPQRIVHVMLYAGAGEVIEGPGTGQAVRRIAITERLGQPLDRLAPGSVADDQTVFFGAYLP
jgi:cell wall-associated NlpC family hydrolase